MRIEGRQNSGGKEPEKCEISISNVRAGQITLLVKVGGKQRGYSLNIYLSDEDLCEFTARVLKERSSSVDALLKENWELNETIKELECKLVASE